MTMDVEPNDAQAAVHTELVEGLRAQFEWLRLTHAPGLPEAAPQQSAALVAAVDDAEPTAALMSAEMSAEMSASISQQHDVLLPQAALQSIRDDIGDCQRCKLHTKRKNIVFGQGNPQAELVFVGEGPGAEEDRQGLAFVGKAGELLTKMIKAMGYSRDDVYICNIVKCRPPGNRDPQRDEVEACEPFLKAQLAVLKPKVIVAMGKYAAQTLLASSTPISRLRGQWSSYAGVDLMPTFHPAYLLRNPSAKRPVWQDLQAVMRRLGAEKDRS